MEMAECDEIGIISHCNNFVKNEGSKKQIDWN